MRLPPSTVAAALLSAVAAAGLGGCYIEPYSEPIPIPSGYVPPPYSPQSRGGIGPTTTRAVASNAQPRPTWPGRPSPPRAP